MLAFGGVYPWAYMPIGVAGTCFGAALLVASPGRPSAVALLGAFVALLTAIGLQRLPLPVGVVTAISPNTAELARAHLAGMVHDPAAIALSIAPATTSVVWFLTAALGIFAIGFSRSASSGDARMLAQWIAPLGACLAVGGLIQAAVWNGRIYGVWDPYETGRAFGPFINRNHAAGWLLMALPLAAGQFVEQTTRTPRATAHDWRTRLLWLGSPTATPVLLSLACLVLMAVALVATMSRSGMLGLCVAAAVWFVLVRRARHTLAWALAPATLAVLGLVAFISVGPDQVFARFAEHRETGFASRTGIWRDTLRLASRFPLAGTGMGSFGEVMRSQQTVDPLEHYEQAHNDYLQVLSDGGALVSLPLLALLIVVSREASRQLNTARERGGYWLRAGAITGLVAIAAQECVDFSLQIPANAVLCAVLVAIAVRPVSASALPRRTA